MIKENENFNNIKLARRLAIAYQVKKCYLFINYKQLENKNTKLSKKMLKS